MPRRKKNARTFYPLPYQGSARAGGQYRLLQVEGARLQAEVCPAAFKLAAAAENQAQFLFDDTPLPDEQLAALKRARQAFGLPALPDPLAWPYTTGRQA